MKGMQIRGLTAKSSVITMNSKERRDSVLDILENSSAPVTAKQLADKFDVSRQVIVGDIAILRASGIEITSLVKGYIIKRTPEFRRVFKVIHSDEEVENELGIIVDLGGEVADVFVFHRVYGKVSADINITSRHDISDFLKEIASGKSSLLKNVTSGYHYHTVCAKSESTLDTIESALKEAGYIAPLKDHEPIGMGESRY